MQEQDRDPIVTLAFVAALADGHASDAERRALRAAAERLGVADVDGLMSRATSGQIRVREVANRLSDDEARRTAYETAAAVCHSDGPLGDRESRFLQDLWDALGIGADAARGVDERAATLSAAAGGTLGVPATAPAASAADPAPAPTPGAQDEFIQKQAVIAAALELLPERLSTIAVLPLQGRMVYKIAQGYGHSLDSRQVAELAGAVGLGAAGQVVERAVSRMLRGVGRGLLGSMGGGVAGLASAAAVTFAATYALGHVAQKYYSGGRQLSSADLQSLFGRFQADARALFPKLQGQVEQQAKTLNVQQLIQQSRS